jgi:hypothetical protein
MNIETSLRAGCIGALLFVASPVWSAGLVTINGQLTSFQSALSPFVVGGNGTMNGNALTIDTALPGVAYAADPGTLYPQSQTVSLAGGTSEVVFHYSDGTDPTFFNRVAFTAVGAATVNVGDVFKVGTITYQNGFWYPFARVGLQIQLSSADPALDGHTFTGAIIVAVSSPTPFVPDPVSNADYFYLTDASGPLRSLGSVRVYEPHVQPAGNPGNVGTADLYARIGSLEAVRFENPSAAAFLSTSLDPINAIPEPATWALWLAGAAALVARRLGRRTMPIAPGL